MDKESHGELVPCYRRVGRVTDPHAVNKSRPVAGRFGHHVYEQEGQNPKENREIVSDGEEPILKTRMHQSRDHHYH